MANFIDLDFADGEYRFALPIEQISELQEKCDAGIGKIYSRTMAGVRRDGDKLMLIPSAAEFYGNEVREVVLQALIGGKQGIVDGEPVEVKPPRAKLLIRRYLDDQPLIYPWELAVTILSAVIVGFDPPETPGKKGSVATEETPKNPTA